MFFRKAKRIKELEQENKLLRRRFEDLVPLVVTCDPLDIEKYQTVISKPRGIPKDIAIQEAKRDLAITLYNVMKIETDYNFSMDCNLVRASIRVVKER